MTIFKWTIRLACILLLMAVQSCGDNSDLTPSGDKVEADPLKTEKGISTGTIVSQSVGTSGGTVVSADGRLSVSIPAGALSSTRMITIEPIVNHVSLGVGDGYRLGPEGTTFVQPVTLIFKYDDALLAGKPAETLWITTQNTDGTWSANLRSEVDVSTKTVTAQTTHFSDWGLGRFIDFKIAPSSRTVMVNSSISLALVGFDSSGDSPDDLAPLKPIVDDGLEPLAPLTPIPPTESRLMRFRVKNWSLNGTNAPVSNSYGKLNGSGNSAQYTAPAKRPAANVVAVSAELETTNKEGKSNKMMIVSNITIIDSEYYLRVTVDGSEYVYIQYGFGGSIPDGDKYAIVNSAEGDGNIFSISAGYVDGTDMTNIFLASFESPGVGSRSVSCKYAEQVSDDDVSFMSAGPATGLSNGYVKRWMENEVCESEGRCASFSRTFTVYENKSFGEVEGSFSGTVYEEEDDDNCSTPKQHSIQGEFRLVRVQ